MNNYFPGFFYGQMKINDREYSRLFPYKAFISFWTILNTTLFDVLNVRTTLPYNVKNEVINYFNRQIFKQAGCRTYKDGSTANYLEYIEQMIY